jgi:hypothetical protein
MSLVDTWAATGADAFILSENGFIPSMHGRFFWAV